MSTKSTTKMLNSIIKTGIEGMDRAITELKAGNHARVMAILREYQEGQLAELRKATATAIVEEEARRAGATNPSLVAMALEGRFTTEMENGEVVVKITDSAGGAKLNPRTGRPYSVAEFVAELKHDKELGLLFTDGNPVPSASRATANNPWRKGENYNVTEQMRLINSNPTLAAKLKAEADGE